MTQQSKLKGLISDTALFADGYDDAIVGFSDDRVVYDQEKIINILMISNNWDFDEAVEFAEYNIFSCGHKSPYPLFITTL